jgi:hypothetical protein
MTYSPFIRYYSMRGERHYFEPLKDLFDPGRCFQRAFNRRDRREPRRDGGERKYSVVLCGICVLLVKDFEVFGFLCVLGLLISAFSAVKSFDFSVFANSVVLPGRAAR